MADYPLVWYWRTKLPERKGQRCRVLVRARRMNSALVEFDDGFKVVTSRNAVRRHKPADSATPDNPAAPSSEPTQSMARSGDGG